MLKAYLNQTADLQANIGTDDRGQPIYAEAETISCRKQAKFQNVLTKDGQLVQTQHIYYTTQTINEGDMLDGKIISAVSEWTGLHGKIVGYKAVV